jgi:hypothetical protein
MRTVTKKPTKTTVVDSAKQLIAGASKHLGPDTKVPILGGTFTPAEVTAKLQQVVDLREGVDTARASARARLDAERANMASLRAFKSAFVAYVRVVYGTQREVLADFGLHPKKAAAPLSVEDKAAATAKRVATREARHTVGPKVKARIKGAVTGVIVTPVEARAPAVATPTGPTTGTATASSATSPAAATGPTAGTTRRES